MQGKWPTVKLSEVLIERKEKPDLFTILSGGIQIVKKIGFDSGRIELRKESKTKTNMILIKPGDLVISGINAAKGAIAIYDEEKKTPVTATIHYSSYIINKEKADSVYLWFFMRSSTFRRILINNLPGGIKTEVKSKRFLPLEISLPPLEEQKRIVERIEKLVAKIEDATKLRGRAIKEVETFFLSALEVFFGKSISKRWSFKKLKSDKLGYVVAGQHIMSSEYNSSGDGFPYLTGPADFGSKFPIIKRWTYNKKSFAQSGDILLTVKGAGVGKINFAPDFEVAIGRQIMAIRPNLKKILCEYLYLFLEYQFRYFQLIATATTVPGFKKSDVEELRIPLPPLPEQHHIATFLSSLQKKVDKLKKLQGKTEEEIEELIPSILKKAFNGEL